MSFNNGIYCVTFVVLLHQRELSLEIKDMRLICKPFIAATFVVFFFVRGVLHVRSYDYLPVLCPIVYSTCVDPA